VKKFLLDLFTGPDGKTWAIGRIYSLPMLATGLAVPIAAIVKGAPIDFAALGVMYGGLGGGVMPGRHVRRPGRRGHGHGLGHQPHRTEGAAQ